MSQLTFRSAFLLTSLLVAACSGQVVSGGTADGGSGGSSSGGSSSGGSSGGGSCVDIVLSSYDLSCRSAADCITISAGHICSGQCACGGSAVNASGEARYQAALSSLQLGICGCPEEPLPQCLQNQCTVCTGSSNDPPACGSSVVDAGQVEAGKCVNVDVSTYDTSCNTSADCIGITSGAICTGSCACGGSTINIDGQARYEAQTSGIMTAACPCFQAGMPTCVQGQCVLCGFNQPGCPDGG